MYCLSIVSVLFSGLPFNCDSHCVTRRHQASPGTVGENEPWKRFRCCLSPVSCGCVQVIYQIRVTVFHRDIQTPRRVQNTTRSGEVKSSNSRQDRVSKSPSRLWFSLF